MSAENNMPEPSQWLDLYGDRLFRYALARVRLDDVAEDLLQETLLAAIQGFSKFNQQASVYSWLVSILKNKIIDYFRKSKRELPLLDDAAMGEDLLEEQFDDVGHWQMNLVDWGSPDKCIQNQEFWTVFYRCRDRLPEAMARLFMLRLDGFSTEECCQLLDMANANQLLVALSRARMKLRQCLDVSWFASGGA